MKRTIAGAILVVALGGCESDLQVVQDDGVGGTTSSSGGAMPTNGGAANGTCPTTLDLDMIDPFDLPLRWSLAEGQDSDCPAEPADEQACATLQLECQYLGTSRYEFPRLQDCTCYLASGGQGVWGCKISEGWACPAELPATGESCLDWVGADYCKQGDVRCWCEMSGDDTAEWDCGTEAERQSAMEAIDPETPVNELTADERDTWCNWFVVTTKAEPSLSPVSEAGCTLNTGWTLRNEPFAHACMPMLVSSQCEGNLSVSDCPAPIAALTDCVESVLTGAPSPYGCSPYLDVPSCSGTIVVDGGLVPPNSGSLCSVVVE